MAGRSAAAVAAACIAMAFPCAVFAQTGLCECTRNQRAVATASGACSWTDLRDKCTIVFTGAAGNARVSAFLKSRNFTMSPLRVDPGPLPPPGPDKVPAPPPDTLLREIGRLREIGNLVAASLLTLSLPSPWLHRAAERDPQAFAATLFFGLAASIAAPENVDDPIEREKTVSPLAKMLPWLWKAALSTAPELATGYFEKTPRYFSVPAGGDRKILMTVAAGCLEAYYGDVLSAVRSPGAANPPGRCGER